MRYSETTKAVRRVSLLCDGCGIDGPVGGDEREARELAEEIGWILVDLDAGHAYCSACVAKEEQEALERDSR